MTIIFKKKQIILQKSAKVRGVEKFESILIPLPNTPDRNINS